MRRLVLRDLAVLKKGLLLFAGETQVRALFTDIGWMPLRLKKLFSNYPQTIFL